MFCEVLGLTFLVVKELKRFKFFLALNTHSGRIETVCVTYQCPSVDLIRINVYCAHMPTTLL